MLVNVLKKFGTLSRILHGVWMRLFVPLYTQQSKTYKLIFSQVYLFTGVLKSFTRFLHTSSLTDVLLLFKVSNLGN